ncbi:MAG TPA: TonB-dependent receptor [Blastocatellia bacterium]|nr:TonB-dependent receptor [Blastocatellia bacterium]
MSKTTSYRLVYAIAVITLFALFGADRILAQSAVAGAIGGSVIDPNHAAIANATVLLKSLETNKEETAVTTADGSFRFNNLKPGLYRLVINASGFGEYKQEQVLVEVGRLTGIDAMLKVGGASATLDIVAGAQLVNVETKDFASNINQTAINELPINGRRWSNFVILTPGVVPDGSFGLLSFRGISGLLNNNTVDGGDNNQAFFSEERGRSRASYSISQSAVQEFQVNTSNYSAEYGRAAGGVTNAVTKSGTNQYHGDAFYFQRNNDWGARNPLALRSVLVNNVPTQVPIKPEDVRHQFGGTIGGPIVKDKLFYFFSYDQQKRNFPGLGVFSVPNYLDTVNRAQLSQRGITDSQITTVQSFLTGLTGEVPRKGDQKLILPKLDWQINNKHSFTATYNRLRWDSPAGVQTQATNARGRASFGDDLVRVDTGTGRLTSTISPTVVNELRFQYSRDFEFQLSQPPLAIEPRTARNNGSAPDVFLTSGLEFGKPTFLDRASYPDERRVQFADNVTISRGANTIKFGLDVNRVKDILSNLRFESGAYSYNNINDFILDYLNSQTAFAPNAVPCVTNPANPTPTNPIRYAGRCYTSPFNQGFGPRGAEFSTTDYNLYAQYDWKFRPRVTLNFGLRYEYQAMPEAQFPNLSNAFIPNTGRTLNGATSRLPNDRNNFGPRVGFALDLTGNGKSSLRGGYGVYYGRIINSTIYNALLNTGAQGGQFQASVQPAVGPVFPDVLPPTAVTNTQSIQFFSENFGNPTIHQGDVIFEREIMRDTTISASYLISIGRKLPTFLDRNLNFPNGTQTYTIGTGPFSGQTWTVPAFRAPRPNPGFTAMTEIASLVTSEYHAMVLQFNRRLSAGLQLGANYTLSKATDYNQGSVTFTTNNVPFNVFDLGLEKGRSNFDRRHKFIASAVYAPTVRLKSRLATALLDKWSLAPIVQYYTGLPYDATVTGNISNGAQSGVNGSAGSSRLTLVPRNFYTAPNVWNVDLRLSRRFVIKEGMSVEVLGEAFNLFNRFQVTGVNSTLYAISGTALGSPTANVPSFGTPNEAGGTLYRERQIQLGARFRF